MTDSYGGLQIPAQSPDLTGLGKGAPVDRVLDCLGAFVAAILNDRLNTMWSIVAPGLAPTVHKVFTAKPGDVLLNESSLPALFLWRAPGGRMSQMADDIAIKESTINVLWLLDPGTIIQREKRLRMLAVVDSNIHAAVNEGRDPAWTDAGDTDPDAATLGSVLMSRAFLIRPPFVTSSDEIPIVIVPDKGDTTEPVSYRAISTLVMVTEQYVRNAATGGYSADVDVTETVGAFNLETELP